MLLLLLGRTSLETGGRIVVGQKRGSEEAVVASGSLTHHISMRDQRVLIFALVRGNRERSLVTTSMQI